MSSKNLPSLEIFKKTAWDYKNKHNIQITKANDLLAKEYGYKNYQAIKPNLENIFTNKKTDLIKLKELIDDLMEQHKDSKKCILELSLDGIDNSKIRELINKIDYKKIILNQFKIEDIESTSYLMKDIRYDTILNYKGNIIANGIELIIDKKYIIRPENPKKLKHRDRTCILIEIENEFQPQKALVKFLDTKRNGKVDLIDLKICN